MGSWAASPVGRAASSSLIARRTINEVARYVNCLFVQSVRPSVCPSVRQSVMGTTVRAPGTGLYHQAVASYLCSAIKPDAKDNLYIPPLPGLSHRAMADRDPAAVPFSTSGHHIQTCVHALCGYFPGERSGLEVSMLTTRSVYMHQPLGDSGNARELAGIQSFASRE